MFEIDNSLKYIETSQDDVLEIIASINIPLVAAADYPSEPTKAYICSLRKQENTIVLYIYLHIIQSNIGIIYTSTEGPTTEKNYPTMKSSALEFAESMGFLMEDLTFGSLSEQKKESLFNSLPLFIEDLSILKKKAEAEEEAVSLEEVEEKREEKEAVSLEEVEEEREKEEAVSLEEVEVTLPEVEEITVTEEQEAPRPAAAKEVEREEVKIEEPPVEKGEEPKQAPEPSSEEAKIDWEDKELKQALEPIIRFLASL